MVKYLVVLCLFVASTLAGRVDFNDKWRVVGGQDAAEGAHPHQISLRSSGSHSCGGSIVHPEWVITAAHCVTGASPSRLTVVAGTNSLSSGGQTYKVLEIHYHSKYESWTGQNDVAILKTEPIAFNPHVGAVAVETEDIGGDEPCNLSGWGRTSYPGSIPDKLQDLDLLTTTVEACSKAHTARPVYESSICTLTKAGEGACHGDSGGPLTRTVNGKTTLIGGVSWGQPCARGYPDVFARMSSFVGWFNEQCDNCLKH